MKSYGSHSLLRSPSYPLWRDASNSEQENTTSSANAPPKGLYRNKSSSSLFSTGSVIARPLQVRNENVIPSRTISLSTLDVMVESMIDASSRKSSGRVSHKSSWDTDILSPLQEQLRPSTNMERDTQEDTTKARSVENVREIAMSYPHGLTPFINLSSAADAGKRPGQGQMDTEILTHKKQAEEAHPFRRWMSTLHRRKQYQPKTVQPRVERWALDDSDMPPTEDVALTDQRISRHKKSSSFASSGFVTAVKSASISLATLSVAPHSRKARRSTLIRSSHRSSRLSQSLYRPSMDASSSSVRIIDEAARERAIKRRRILEELLSTEEGYVADLKVLVNVS